jgi:sugar diacid utilization regulator
MPGRVLVLLVALTLTSVALSAQAPASKPPAQKAQPSRPAAADQTRTANLAEYAELLRSDVRAEKVAIITEMMEFSEKDNAAFWPIYRDYDAEMSKLGDERVALIEQYAKNFDSLSDATADSLATKAIDLESRRRAAMAKCYDRVKKATSSKTALRFLQVEHQLQLIVDLQISASLPIPK